MQLSNKVYNHVIVFKDRSKKWITDEVYQGLVTMGEDERFSVEGNIYNFKMVDKVLTREEFYREYPENRPAVYSEVQSSKPVKLNERRRELILKGIEQAVGKNDFYYSFKKVIARKDKIKFSELL